MAVLACSIRTIFSSPLQAGAMFYWQPRGTAIPVDTQPRDKRVWVPLPIPANTVCTQTFPFTPCLQSSPCTSCNARAQHCHPCCCWTWAAHSYAHYLHFLKSIIFGIHRFFLLFITLISRSTHIFALWQLNMKSAAATVSLGELWSLINKLLREDNGSGICRAN